MTPPKPQRKIKKNWKRRRKNQNKNKNMRRKKFEVYDCYIIELSVYAK